MEERNERFTLEKSETFDASSELRDSQTEENYKFDYERKQNSTNNLNLLLNDIKKNSVAHSDLNDHYITHKFGQKARSQSYWYKMESSQPSVSLLF